MSQHSSDRLDVPLQKKKKTLIKSFMQDVDDSPLPVRILKTVDIFSFIPVPKDQSVSTRQSLIGTALFFIIFGAYIILDGVKFIIDNPPVTDNYFGPLDETQYKIPEFAVGFMYGEDLNQTDTYENYISYSYSRQYKDKGVSNSTKIPLTIQKKPSWLDSQTNQFYSTLWMPTEDVYVKGLLYSTSNASFSKIGINKCNLNQPNNTCKSQLDIAQFVAGGRVFLFVKNDRQNRANDQEQVPYLIYNFFLIPNFYKRVTVNLQVNQIQIAPDYFHRIFTEKYTQISVQNILQQTSNTSINDQILDRSSLQMLSINFQLTQQVLYTRVTYQTLLQHISMWGAFFSVLFGLFSIIFLTYNKRTFYKRRPDWDHFRDKKQSSPQPQQHVIDFRQHQE